MNDDGASRDGCRRTSRCSSGLRSRCRRIAAEVDPALGALRRAGRPRRRRASTSGRSRSTASRSPDRSPPRKRAGQIARTTSAESLPPNAERGRDARSAPASRAPSLATTSTPHVGSVSAWWIVGGITPRATVSAGDGGLERAGRAQAVADHRLERRHRQPRRALAEHGAKRRGSRPDRSAAWPCRAR